MAIYLTPVGRRYGRRLANHMVNREWPDRENEVVFPVDIKTGDEEYVLYALMPGLSPEDLDIQVVNETVSLKGEFKNEREEGTSYLIQERPSGKFCRMINLPERVDAARAEARMENGVLILRLPKAEEARPKTIKINAK